MATNTKKTTTARPRLNGKAGFYKQHEEMFDGDLKAALKAKDWSDVQSLLHEHGRFLLRHPEAIPEMTNLVNQTFGKARWS